jgi:hypothetical protein
MSLSIIIVALNAQLLRRASDGAHVTRRPF